jgi:hypothetical protein
VRRGKHALEIQDPAAILLLDPKQPGPPRSRSHGVSGINPACEAQTCSVK